MPSTIKIRVYEAQDLPVMDTKTKLADAYVQIRFDEHRQQTCICRRSLNPVWNEDFRIEVADDITLQDTPIEFKVWDKDFYTKDDTIGSVVVDLTSLLTKDSPGKLAGWFPIFDTIRGIRGRLRLTIKLQFFGDVNPFKDSAAGVQLFSASSLEGYEVQAVHGFVEELVVHDDPEYHWVDSFRRSRASNEARQLLFDTLSRQIRRNVGRKALDLNGNSVLAYQQYFDLEGEESGIIVARGIGTACTIRRLEADGEHEAKHDSTLLPLSYNRTSTPALNATPDPESGGGTSGVGVIPYRRVRRKHWNVEVQLLTMTSFTPAVSIQYGGIVSAHAIKLLTTKDAHRETRDQWWTEIRSEIRSHCQALNCTFVIGYKETTSLHDDMVVLSAVGTSARLSWAHPDYNFPDMARTQSSPLRHSQSMDSYVREQQQPAKKRKGCFSCHLTYSRNAAPLNMNLVPCQICHRKFVPEILLSTTQPPADLPIVHNGQLIEARICRRKQQSFSMKREGEMNPVVVSEALPFLQYDLHTQLLYKLRVAGMNAVFGLETQISVGDNLIVGIATGTAMYLAALPPPPRLEIARHIAVQDDEDVNLVRIQKRIHKISCRNEELWKDRLADWKTQNLTTSSTVHLSRRIATPEPQHELELPPIGRQRTEPIGSPISRPSQLETASSVSPKKRHHSPKKGLRMFPSSPLHDEKASSDSDSSIDDETFGAEEVNKQSFVLHIDDDLDEDRMAAILDPTFPPQIMFCNTEWPISVDETSISQFKNLQLLTAIRRVKWMDMESRKLNQALASIFSELYARLIFKMRAHTPCYITNIRPTIHLPHEDSIELVLTAMALTAAPGRLQNISPMKLPDSVLSDQTERKEEEPQHLVPEILPRYIGSANSNAAQLPVDADDSSSSDSDWEDQIKSERRSYSIDLTSPTAADAGPSHTVSASKIGDESHSDSSSSDSSSSSSDGEEGDPVSLESKMRVESTDDLDMSRDIDHAKAEAVELQNFEDGVSHGGIVESTVLSHIPNAYIEKYLGRVNIHYVKEIFSAKEKGGLGAFVHKFLSEVNSLARTQVASRGGNALVCYKVNECKIIESNKDQAYSVISVSGDAVRVTRKHSPF